MKTEQLDAVQIVHWSAVRADLCRNNPLAQEVISEALDRGVAPHSGVLAVAFRDGRLSAAELAFCEHRQVDPALYAHIRNSTGLSFREIVGRTFDLDPEEIRLPTGARTSPVNTDSRERPATGRGNP